MMSMEYIILPFIINQVSHILNVLKTDYIIIDCCIFGLIYLIYNNTINVKFLLKRIFSILKISKNKQTIVLNTYENKRSIKFSAIMHYLANKNKTIYKIREVTEECGFDDYNNTIEKSEYLVDQTKEFVLTPLIFGVISTASKEKSRGFIGSDYIEYNVLKIYSYSLTLDELQKWINTIVKQYKQHLKIASNETQLYITALSNIKNKKNNDNRNINHLKTYIHLEAVEWESTIRFDNSYFHDMDAVIKKIDFFLNNKAWYQERGIPYNLGILLYGEPGCGKTRFIKQLMNYTGRHGIDIKLNDQMNFQDLYNIIFNEEINEKYIIPQEQRILIFEDIDAMGDVVKCRDIKIKEREKTDEFIKVDSTNILQEFIKNNNKNFNNDSSSDDESVSSSIRVNNPNNSLSYLLNMFDGINECSGRIIIMTSNKPEVLDAALIRPGRIDIKIHFTKCTKYDVMRLINLFWDLDITEEMILPELEMKYTSAEIYNIFRSTCNFKDIEELFLQK